jgi:TRAP-type mannitol/chloroaromatic compound transport system permease large subunit
MVFLIFLGATCFSYVFRALGGDDLMISTLKYFGIDTKWEMLTFVMVLSFPFEWIEICLIVLPIFAPILMKFDFADHIGDKTHLMVWFGTLVAVNLQTSFMTPPFGATLFYMKGTVPPGVTMSDVYKGMYPFVALQIVGVPGHRALAPARDRPARLKSRKGPTRRRSRGQGRPGRASDTS